MIDHPVTQGLVDVSREAFDRHEHIRPVEQAQSYILHDILPVPFRIVIDETADVPDQSVPFRDKELGDRGFLGKCAHTCLDVRRVRFIAASRPSFCTSKRL